MAPLRVAIVGRPNVGKSTLFNRLADRRAALVDPAPGMTRDLHAAPGLRSGGAIEIVDTPGFDATADDTLAGRMTGMSTRALAEADLVLFVIDGRQGVTPVDRTYAQVARSSARAVTLLVNKCDTPALAGLAVEGFELGLGDPVPISAEHGLGMAEVEAVIAARTPAGSRTADGDPEPHRPIPIAVVGRPNTGKSTLINRLLGEERMLAGPEPGITRDAIDHVWTWRGHPIRLVDTAGLRRAPRVDSRPEAVSADSARRALQFAEVAILMLDCREALVDQDLTIAAEVVREGRTLVVAANKWDLVRRPGVVRRALRQRLAETLPQARGVPCIALSARTGHGTSRLMQAVLAAHQRWNRRVPTPALNRWLRGRVEAQAPPRVGGRTQRLRFVTQVNVRPPTFALFANHPKGLPRSYLRYLANDLRDTFDLDGVPLRIMVRKGENPYANRTGVGAEARAADPPARTRNPDRRRSGRP